MQPIVLPANQPERFYRGGELIANFRGEPAHGDYVPEDWVASTTTVAGHEHLGLTTLPDGRRLVDAIAADPAGWLGADHVARFGSDTRLLVKLLHAGQRLPVHAHPDAAFATRWLGRPHGKAEAWHILHGGEVYLGVLEDVPVARLADLVDRQDTAAILALLHRRQVAPGDTVFVPPGTLHAIGSGMLIAEVQEPEDLSILIEGSDVPIDVARDGHLGLGFDVAFEALHLSGMTAEQIDRLIIPARLGRPSLPPEAGTYFRIERFPVEPPARTEAGFAVTIVLDGEVCISYETGELSGLPAGSTLVVPAAAGEVTVSGVGTVLIFRPPAA